MMTISAIETSIRNDWKAARLARDCVKATLLGTLVGAIMTKEKTFNPARSMTAAEVISEVKKMLDGVVETGRILAATDGRDDQRATNAIERGVLEVYMPSQMSEAELEEFAQRKKAEGLNMGGIMAALKAERGGEYDGKMASVIVKRVLA
jgi:uncharacterized protein YqeY